MLGCAKFLVKIHMFQFAEGLECTVSPMATGRKEIMGEELSIDTKPKENSA